MRSLLLILKIFVAALLVVQPIDSLASKSKINNSKKILKKNTLRDSSNVWDRVRLGQLPRYYSKPAKTTVVISNKKTLNTETEKQQLLKTTELSVLHHDETNRNRLHTVIAKNQKEKTKLSNAELKEKIDGYVNANLSSASNAQTRIRTRIEFPNKKSKLDKPTEAISKPESIIVKTTLIKNGVESKTIVGTKLGKTVTTSSQETKVLASANERIGKHIAWYSQHAGYIQQVAERARPYLYHIVNELSANHLPTELALLPIVESAYQPKAQSLKDAAGLWQFIPSTGLEFGLPQTDHYDARLDITASTQAAIRYLTLLKHHFHGDWLLALAAYNCGQGRVDDAISNNRANGLPTDYWSLHLPEETQEYVPRFLALSSIFANPKAYGVKLPIVKNEPYFVKFKVDRQFDIDYLATKPLSTVAELANLSYEQFIKLNPGYIKPTLAANRPFTLLLPSDNAKQLNQHLNHVARFVAEPNVVNNTSILHKKPEIKSESAKQLAAIELSTLLHKTARIVSPLLSLNINQNQTTPRVNHQPLITNINSLTLGLAA